MRRTTPSGFGHICCAVIDADTRIFGMNSWRYACRLHSRTPVLRRHPWCPEDRLCRLNDNARRRLLPARRDLVVGCLVPAPGHRDPSCRHVDDTGTTACRLEAEHHIDGHRRLCATPKAGRAGIQAPPPPAALLESTVTAGFLNSCICTTSTGAPAAVNRDRLPGCRKWSWSQLLCRDMFD